MTAAVPERLRSAIDAGDLATVRKLIGEVPALLTAIVNPDRQYRPLTEAAMECQIDILRFLIASGGGVNEDHNFPMFRASLSDRNIPALEMLTEHGANMNDIWDDYGPPIIAACEGRTYGCMEWLLAHGARIAGSGRGKTKEVAWNALVHAAHFKDKPELLTLLLEHGADPDARSRARGEEGMAAFHVAAKKGNIPGVKILLKHGAARRLKNDDGKTPLELTRNKQVAKLLETVGA